MDEIFKAQGEASERRVFAPRLHEEPTERETTGSVQAKTFGPPFDEVAAAAIDAWLRAEISASNGWVVGARLQSRPRDGPDSPLVSTSRDWASRRP